MHTPPTFFNRELSWLSFNARVLQEATAPSTPLFERVKFLAIFSSNMDEFFRVRVASLRTLLSLKKKTKKQLEFDPEELLDQIHGTVQLQQEQFGAIFRNQILPELARHNIFIRRETELNRPQQNFVRNYFDTVVSQHITPLILDELDEVPFLDQNVNYLAFTVKNKKKKSEAGTKKTALIKIPTADVPRFAALPRTRGKYFYIYLDDIIRYNLPFLFPGSVVSPAYSIKLTRDADLMIDDEFSGDLIENIQKGLKRRKSGIPSRFLYDLTLPKDFLRYLREYFSFQKEDLIPGGRYHNFYDFFSFPFPNIAGLTHTPLAPAAVRPFETSSSMFEVIAKRDVLLSVPYQSYGYVVRFLEEAANDPLTTDISITLYRVASNSGVVQALIKAARSGKKVVAFVELKARFDEESNIYWANELEKAGAHVLYSIPGLKVHCKVCVVKRRENNAEHVYAYVGTGNFNEKTAKIYCDHGIFTANPEINAELIQVMQLLRNNELAPTFAKLLVARINMRSRFEDMIDREIKYAQQGAKAQMILKMNSLEDSKMIKKLYEASKAGVKIIMIIRGICCLVPGIPGVSENIKVYSIVGRFLEHARMYIFHNNGDEEYYIASADWMSRNLKHRIEVGIPIESKSIQKELKRIINIQLRDNVKSRIINAAQDNPYRQSQAKKATDAQMEIYDYLSAKA